MKINEFYKKYANMPLEKRKIPFTPMDNYAGDKVTPSKLYQMINGDRPKSRFEQADIDRLLKIADEIIK